MVTPSYRRFLPTAGALLFGLGCFLAIWFALAPILGHGYDITDQAGYLVSADPPSDEYTYLGFYGFYLHPLYAAVGYDVAAYRSLGALLMMAAGALTGYSAWYCLRARDGLSSPFMATLFAIAGMIAAANEYVISIVTPGYSWLTLIGMLIALAGVLQLLPRPPTKYRLIFGSGLVSVGSFLAFIGRPPAGAGIWVAGVVAIAFFARTSRRSRLLMVAFSIAWLAACLLLHFVFIASPGRSIEVLQQTAYFAQVGTPNQSFLSMALTQLADSPARVWGLAGISLAAMFLPLLALLVAPARRGKAAAALVIAAAAIVFFSCAAHGGLQGGIPWAGRTQPYLWMALVTVAGGALICAWVVRPHGETDEKSHTEPIGFDVTHFWVVIVLLIGSPLLFGASSGNGAVLMLAIGGSVFLVLAFMVLLAVTTWRWSQPGVGVTAGCIICAVAITVALLTAQNHPYRSNSIDESQTLTVVTWRGSRLMLSEHNAAVLDQVASATAAAGFQPGTPLADFTRNGLTPGLGYRINSLTPSTLVLGATNEASRKSLSEQDRFTWCATWLVTSQDTGEWVLDPDKILSVLGMSRVDYRPVINSQWQGYYNSTSITRQDFTIWQPLPESVARCRAQNGTT